MAGKQSDPVVAAILRDRRAWILDEWVGQMTSARRSGRAAPSDVRRQCESFLDALSEAVDGGNMTDVEAPAFEAVRDFLDDFSRSRAAAGFSSSETAIFIFALKKPLFEAVRQAGDGSPERSLSLAWEVSLLLDGLGLRTVESYQKNREEVIVRQQQEIAELSTPVVQLWDGILAIPLIGTLDSGRTQVVMESLLEAIVDHGAEIAVIDITGVPTVDTLVAQHLLKTVAAARLMGADCIISGIRPQIAQTMVHLGVELDVASKPSLADALALALERTGRVVRQKPE